MILKTTIISALAVLLGGCSQQQYAKEFDDDLPCSETKEFLTSFKKGDLELRRGLVRAVRRCKNARISLQYVQLLLEEPIPGVAEELSAALSGYPQSAGFARQRWSDSMPSFQKKRLIGIAKGDGVNQLWLINKGAKDPDKDVRSEAYYAMLQPKSQKFLSICREALSNEVDAKLRSRLERLIETHSRGAGIGK